MSDKIDKGQNYIAKDTSCETVEDIVNIIYSSVLNAKFTNSNLSTQSILDNNLKTVKPYDKTKNSYENKHTILKKKLFKFDSNDEKIRKFTSGEPIVDQQNPFKNIHVTGKDRKMSPPVPVRLSTLSVRKNVTQRLRERELEKLINIEKKDQTDKQRKHHKNETNIQKYNVTKVNLSADEFITTDEVLKQSKFIKTYIKNPDPFFVYDPTVLARLKFEELSEIACKKPRREQPLAARTLSRLRESKTHTKNHKETNNNNNKETEIATFKKCSKPNYPELANLKIRIGSKSNGEYLNLAEVAKNAKKFDERVKKLQINSDDDLDDIDGPLTKSDSGDELNLHTSDKLELANKYKNMTNNNPKMTTFTNTISSKEFTTYLQRKDLTLMPNGDVNSPASSATPNSTPTPKGLITLQTDEEHRQQVFKSFAILSKEKSKKISVQQRLSNNFHATRSKNILKDIKLLPPTVFGDSDEYSKYNKTKGLSHNRQLKNAAQPSLIANSSEFLAKPSEINMKGIWRIHIKNSKLDNVPLQCNNERQSVIPRNVTPEDNLGLFIRDNDRIQIKLQEQRNLTRLGSVCPHRSAAISMASDQYPNAISTPIRKAPEQQRLKQAESAINDHNEWKQLRAIKEVIDKKLYYKVLQQQQDHQHQQQSQSEENIYERLHSQHQPQYYFVRGLHQRSTFSDITDRNQQVILDGTSISRSGLMLTHTHQLPSPRYQSVMAGLKALNSQDMPRGYESENETPEILGRKKSTARRIGGLLTREEILNRVKEFCHKSINRSPLPSATKVHLINERRNTNVSPVSFAPVKAITRKLIAGPQRVKSYHASA